MHAIEHIQYIKTGKTKVYTALSTQEGLGNIWTENLEVRNETGTTSKFNWGEDYTTEMEIQELKPDERILWKCTASDPEWVGTCISFDLTEEKGVTKLVLKHYNWREVTDYYRWCNYNWAMFLLSLKQYCEEGKGKPYRKN
ncbi:SRPBCC family protein [Chitinophaga tropicalis]|uniref:SRPBCC domain-containing protein n=1 Tax=Chitinophaga tropicalis TaxID=2683588 RepID=A0A7K1U797_9BACT|nr:SRPBCC domain-containing protein [Chitinophaga tropicalis]MVT10219.1 SRPBCC domain-containing protein [Chitinophaga tropicalis]